MQVTLYGIANCDKVRAARAWLAEHGVEARFHDFKRQGVTPALLAGWLKQLAWTELVNRKGTTWKQLPQTRRDGITSAAAASALMQDKPSVIKRPVLDLEGKLHLGFDAGTYSSLFGQS
ncbi:MAG: ArsC family reductase [Burkholderiales bacterium]|nr:ArsC family reductase [Burkholderiales bacterium]